MTFAEQAIAAITKNYHKILKHEVGVIKDKDAEELHQMRVGIRRLRSSLGGFAAAIDIPATLEDKHWRGVARILGELRDIDVLQETLFRTYQPLLSSTEKKHFQKILTALKERRQETYENVRDLLQSKAYIKLKEVLEEWLVSPETTPWGNSSIEEVLPELLLPQTCKLLLHPGWRIGKDQEEILHDLRKEAKKSRYQMELFTSFYGEDYQNYLEKIKEVQTILGNLQDVYVLQSFIQELELVKKVPSLVQKSSEIREESWKKWLLLQEEFLTLEYRKSLRQILVFPVRN